jgi:predicted amidophosphoribosyltransferase
MASCVYGGPVRAAVLAHKEQGRLALARPLGDVLARAVAQLLTVSKLDHRPVALVPAPSARAAIRQRGHDPLLRITRRAAIVLRRDGLDCAVVPALRHRRRVSDQAGLGQIARLANLHGSMIVRSGAATLLTGRSVVIVDDVVTTGATIGEAVRAVRRFGHDPCGAAVIAAAP